VRAVKAHMGLEIQFCAGWEWGGGVLHAAAALPPGETPPPRFFCRVGGPRSGFG
jgi:hypothetical protein